jgi:hypothetical protein
MGRYMERPVTCTVQHMKHDCCCRSGRALPARGRVYSTPAFATSSSRRTAARSTTPRPISKFVVVAVAVVAVLVLVLVVVVRSSCCCCCCCCSSNCCCCAATPTQRHTHVPDGRVLQPAAARRTLPQQNNAATRRTSRRTLPQRNNVLQ